MKTIKNVFGFYYLINKRIFQLESSACPFLIDNALTEKGNDQYGFHNPKYTEPKLCLSTNIYKYQHTQTVIK